MSGKFTEDHVEQACLDWLEALDYDVLHGPDISPDGHAPDVCRLVKPLPAAAIKETIGAKPIKRRGSFKR